MNPKNKLFLIDGHALVFKMYYAFLGRPMMNSKGVDTSILFGFTKYLIELIEREKPTHLAVSFDLPGGTFRNEMYPPYKANRGETPQLVIDALCPLQDIVRAMGIPVVAVSGFEADDVIGTIAKKAGAKGYEVYMVTPDKDFGQLVDENISQYKPGKSGSDTEVLGIDGICAKWNIDRPSQVIDILTIVGDTADNVPGVDGVGPVGAGKLLRKYGSVEEIYNNLDFLTPRMKEQFEQARPHVGLSKTLVTIKTDVPIGVEIENMALKIVLSESLRSIFKEFEFFSLTKRVGAIAVTEEQAKTDDEVAALGAYEKVEVGGIGGKELALALADGMLYVAAEGKVACGRPQDFRQILESEDIAKTGEDLKGMMNAFAAEGIGLNGPLRDLGLMHYLINPERSHALENMLRSVLGVEMDQMPAGGEEASLFDAPAQSETDMFRVTALLPVLCSKLWAEMGRTDNLVRLYREIEEPLIGVLSRMERAGVKVDMGVLEGFAEELRGEIARREAQIRELCGVPELNPSSPKQIGEALFEKMKIAPEMKRPKTGNWPTDEQTLSELADRSPVIDAILDYRGMKKLLSTYIEPFPSYVSPSDGRVHTTFNQALTSTGRLSSSNPNLQNIPIRTDQGKEIRKAFVSRGEDWVIMSADYSQIELRLMAHLCGDEHMLAAFRNGEDVHAATAAKIYGIPVGEVTSDQRRSAKTANFGIMYGISAFGLSQRLKCSRKEAKQLIDDYFESFPSIRQFIDRTLAVAREKGYVETIFGRRRYVPDVNSRQPMVRALAERNAVNAPIQGSAADIIKLAMAGVDRRLREEGLRSRMTLQIHDELLLDVHVDEIEKVKELLVSQMENVVKLSVPLTVECNYGKTWLEAH